MERSQHLRRIWYYVVRKSFATRYGCMPHCIPSYRQGRRPEWWWPRRSREVTALQALGELHYWERPFDPFWYERSVERIVSPLAEQSAARLADAPLSSVPHLPYIPHPWPRSSCPFHVASHVGTPAAARLFPGGYSPISGRAQRRRVQPNHKPVLQTWRVVGATWSRMGAMMMMRNGHALSRALRRLSPRRYPTGSWSMRTPSCGMTRWWEKPEGVAV